MVELTQEDRNEICNKNKYCATCPLVDCGCRE